jgi:hypothetical protein
MSRQKSSRTQMIRCDEGAGDRREVHRSLCTDNYYVIFPSVPGFSTACYLVPNLFRRYDSTVAVSSAVRMRL